MNKKSKKWVKFIGSYKDLTQKYGYVFQKLCAENYETYSKEASRHSTNTVWIWSAENEVEWSSFFGLSYLVFETAKNFVMPIDKSFVRFIIDEKEETIDRVDMNNITHKSIDVWGTLLPGFKLLLLDDKTIKLINELWDNNLIEIISNK